MQVAAADCVHPDGDKPYLVVLVHGLGADESRFWGSTVAALRCHHKIQPQHDVITWGYETSKGPLGLVRRVKLLFGTGYARESISQLGDHLWTHLQATLYEKKRSKVVLVGHSMGGLVVAAALGEHLLRGDPYDRGLRAAIRAPVFIASPLGGAKMARLARQLYRPVGVNVHVNDLAEGSDSRRVIVSQFIEGPVTQLGLVPHLFRASGDSTVTQHEVVGALGDGQYRLDVLEGTHSGCVRGLGSGSQNLSRLVMAIGQITNPDADVVRPSVVNGVVSAELARAIAGSMSGAAQQVHVYRNVSFGGGHGR